MAHSFLPPSGAAAWSRCALWPTMNAQFPQSDSPESIEGTAAHWVLSERVIPSDEPKNIVAGSLAPNGAIITEEMIEGAELVADVIGARFPVGALLHVEETVGIATVSSDCFGTPDVWGFDLGKAHLEIVDYKFGHGFVDEFFNLQGMLYALGILENIKTLGDPKYVTVSFTIVQPRCFMHGEPVRTHSYRIADIDQYVSDLRRAAAAAYVPNPRAITGPHCEYCPGRHACSSLQQAAYNAAEFSNDRQPHTLTPQAAALELRMLETALGRLEARVEGLRELTLANIKAGAQIPYYRAEAGKGRAHWTLPDEQIITIGKMLGKDLSKVSVITPSQAAKNNIDASVISAYSQIIPGSVKLVVQDNKEAAKVFGRGELK